MARKVSSTTKRSSSRKSVSSRSSASRAVPRRRTVSSARKTTGRSGTSSVGSRSSAAGKKTVSARGRTTGASRPVAARGSYTSVRSQLTSKISSYRVLLNQVQGTGRGSQPSPTAVSRMAGWVGRGAHVYQVTNHQVNRVAGAGKKVSSAVSALRVLQSRYGKVVKAVAPGKSGSWLVAAVPQSGRKVFRPNW